LTASYTLPSGGSVTSQSWTIPGTSANPPTAISNFTVTSTSGGPVTLTANQLAAQSITFYWIVPTAANSPNTVTFTLNYKINGTAQPAATATTTFTVVGPTAPNVVTCGGNVPGKSCPNGQSGPLGTVVINPGPTLAFGNTSSNIGIVFNASATPPSGYSNSFTWVHLITANTITIKASNVTFTCIQNTQPANTNNGTGLDTEFPYGTGTAVDDNPDFPLDTSYGTQITGVTEVVDSPFSATMYLLWSPGLTNSILVPLGSVAWQWSGDAKYNAGTQTWSVASGSGSASQFQSSTAYPTWSSIVPFTGATCH